MIKLVDLVLEQSFASRIDIDILALAEEMKFLFHSGGDVEKARKRKGELRSYPDEFVENNVQTEVYRKYVDDVQSQISGMKIEVMNGMSLNIWQSQL